AAPPHVLAPTSCALPCGAAGTWTAPRPGSATSRLLASTPGGTERGNHGTALRSLGAAVGEGALHLLPELCHGERLDALGPALGTQQHRPQHVGGEVGPEVGMASQIRVRARVQRRHTRPGGAGGCAAPAPARGPRRPGTRSASGRLLPAAPRSTPAAWPCQ